MSFKVVTDPDHVSLYDRGTIIKMRILDIGAPMLKFIGTDMIHAEVDVDVRNWSVYDEGGAVGHHQRGMLAGCFAFIATLLMVLVMCGGCVTAPYWVRRAVVHNDWVYVKRSQTLHRRYLPKGPRLVGNPELLAEQKSITASNFYVIVYGSYQAAVNHQGKCRIGPASKRFVTIVTEEDDHAVGGQWGSK